MTLQVQVGALDEARRFYGAVFGGPPQFEPHEDFLEWRVGAQGETWLQVIAVPDDVRPLPTRIRFRVTDVPAARAAVRADGIEASPVTTLPGVVRFFDFADPWGNRLGCYEDLLPSGTQPSPGGSVRDEAQFLVEEPERPGAGRTGLPPVG